MKTILKLEGLHCSSCVNTIEKSLKDKKGIISLDISFARQEANIEFDEKLISEDEIIQIIKNSGYKAHHGNHIESDIKKRWILFWFGLVLTIPIFIIDTILKKSGFSWHFLLFILATPVQIFLGWPFYKGTYYALKQKTIDMNSLVALSTSAAYFYSLYITFLSQGAVFFGAATTILTTITLGNLLEKISQGKVSDAINKLMQLKPKKAHIIRDNKELEVNVSEIKKNDIVSVKPGEQIPTDGIIYEGYSSIDESMLTGESIPKSKKIGDEVFGATINKEGFFKFKATKIGEETVLSQIINLVKEAQSKKAPIQRLANKVVVWFVPIVLIISIISFIIWNFIENKSVAFSLTSSIAVLIIACPCALGIATPTAIMAGTAIGAENGILFKGASFLEKTKELNTICFDKTGTLTKGEPEVTDIVNDVLQLAASLAKNSAHPLDKAIIDEAKKRNVELLKVENFESLTGMGIKGTINNKEFLLGNRKLIKTDLYQNLEEEGKTIIILSEDASPKGAIAIKDMPKENSKEAIEELKKMGLEIYLITGDNKKTAQAIAKNLNIDNVISEVLPQNKEQEIEKLQALNKIVGAVGDGINDAPMIAKADIGIAMGAGSDIAKETGNIILVKDDVQDVVKAIKLSKQTLKKIKQNIFFAFIYNIIAIPIAAGVLYPILGFLLKPEIAAIAMILSDITVITNSLILRRSKL